MRGWQANKKRTCAPPVAHRAVPEKEIPPLRELWLGIGILPLAPSDEGAVAAVAVTEGEITKLRFLLLFSLPPSFCLRQKSTSLVRGRQENCLQKAREGTRYCVSSLFYPYDHPPYVRDFILLRDLRNWCFLWNNTANLSPQG